MSDYNANLTERPTERAVVAALIEQGSDETAHMPAVSPSTVAEDGLLHGVCAAPGLAIGPIFLWRPADIAVPERGSGEATESAALTAARQALLATAPAGDIAARLKQLHGSLDAEAHVNGHLGSRSPRPAVDLGDDFRDVA